MVGNADPINHLTMVIIYIRTGYISILDMINELGSKNIQKDRKANTEAARACTEGIGVFNK